MSVSDSSWLHFWETLSTMGFILVIAGCVIEGVEHFIKFKRGENAKKHLIEKIGWFILIGGLPVEFVAENRAKRIADKENTRLTREAAEADARAGTAYKLAGEANERAASNELARAKLEEQIAGLNPLKQPVISLSAYADFAMDGDRTITTNRNGATKYCAFLSIWSVRHQKNPYISLAAEKFDGWSGGEVQMFFYPFGIGARRVPDTAGELLEKLDALSMDLYFLSNNGTNCRGGFIILTVNSLLTKRFEIPPQGAKSLWGRICRRQRRTMRRI